MNRFIVFDLGNNTYITKQKVYIQFFTLPHGVHLLMGLYAVVRVLK